MINFRKKKSFFIDFLLVIVLLFSILACEKEKITEPVNEKIIASLRPINQTYPKIDYFDFSKAEVITIKNDSITKVEKDMYYFYNPAWRVNLYNRDADGRPRKNFIQLLSGYKRLDNVKVVPDTGYYSSDEAIIDSIYAIITFEGNYSIIQITNKDSTDLSFKWKYQPNGSPNFP